MKLPLIHRIRWRREATAYLFRQTEPKGRSSPENYAGSALSQVPAKRNVRSEPSTEESHFQLKSKFEDGEAYCVDPFDCQVPISPKEELSTPIDQSQLPTHDNNEVLPWKPTLLQTKGSNQVTQGTRHLSRSPRPLDYPYIRIDTINETYLEEGEIDEYMQNSAIIDSWLKDPSTPISPKVLSLLTANQPNLRVFTINNNDRSKNGKGSSDTFEGIKGDFSGRYIKTITAAPDYVLSV